MFICPYPVLECETEAFKLNVYICSRKPYALPIWPSWCNLLLIAITGVGKKEKKYVYNILLCMLVKNTQKASTLFLGFVVKVKSEELLKTSFTLTWTPVELAVT